MSADCTSEPISFLRLERYLQGDLQGADRERIAAHLRECPVCSACFEALRSEVIELPALPQRSASPKPRQVWLRSSAWPLSMLAAAALLAIALLPRAAHEPSARVRIKGGELAIELIREHRGALANDARVFAGGDRFEVRVSCPPETRTYWDVVVFQAGEASFPLQPQGPLRCANGITLPGAFEISGSARATVCVQIDERTLDRDLVTRGGVGALKASSACTTLDALHDGP